MFCNKFSTQINCIQYETCFVIMRPSSLGGAAYCVALCLSVCLSVRPSRARMYFVYICTVLRAHIQNRKTSGFAYGPASRMYFSARAEGRIWYGHLVLLLSTHPYARRFQPASSDGPSCTVYLVVARLFSSTTAEPLVPPLCVGLPRS